jgi:hypothetical protein
LYLLGRNLRFIVIPNVTIWNINIPKPFKADIELIIKVVTITKSSGSCLMWSLWDHDHIIWMITISKLSP